MEPVKVPGGYRGWLSLCVVFGFLSGCATYENHYSRFQAVNSAGEPRSFLLSWQTKRTPVWSPASDAATAVRLETQCSDRVWLLRDASNGACEVTEGGSPAAIRACGTPDQDLDRQGRPLSVAEHQCMSLTDTRGSESILDLGNEVLLTVSCFPAETEVQQADEVVNQDYLKPSVIPYSIPVRTAPMYSKVQRPPVLDDAICGDD